MYAENFGSDDGSNGKTIEHVNERLPRLDITASLAFVIKTINFKPMSIYRWSGHSNPLTSRNIGTFVIASQ